ncbi:MAG: hypothetical protein EOP04_00350 [Proteobacteria bacterium]|nr:MAG: hypothetical protein EOP04_00350 [Pseudomonadota bacterium]
MEELLTARSIIDKAGEALFPTETFKARSKGQTEFGPKEFTFERTKVRVLVDAPSEYVVLRIEPFTWTWVAVNLAEGAIAWLGGVAISKVLGIGGNVKPVEQLQEESLKRISQVFVQVLQAERLVQATDKLTSIQRNMLEYSLAPKSSADRLYFATNDSSELLATLATLRWVGLESYLTAASLRHIILQERYKASGDPGELLTLAYQVRRSFDESASAMLQAEELVRSVIFPGIINTPIPGVYAYYFRSELILGGTYDETVRAANAHKGQFYNAEVAPILTAASAVRDSWWTLRLDLSERIKAAGLELPPGWS